MSWVSLTLCLEAALGQALLLYNIENIVRRSGDQEMLSLLLSPHLLSALLDCPSAGVSLVSTLTRLLLLLSSSQLNTLLHNTCPVRLDYILDLPPENRWRSFRNPLNLQNKSERSVCTIFFPQLWLIEWSLSWPWLTKDWSTMSCVTGHMWSQLWWSINHYQAMISIRWCYWDTCSQ